MEFKLNKIDTDLRQKINAERSEDKIHNKKGINVNKDKERTKESIEKEKKKFKKLLEAVEENDDKNDAKTEDIYRGHYIDTRK